MTSKALTWDGKDDRGKPLTWDTPGRRWDGTVSQNRGTHMNGNIRVLLGLVGAKDHTIEEIAGAVIKGLTNNPAFPSPPVTPAAMQTAKDRFTVAIAAQNMGGKAATIEKNAARAALVGLIRLQAAYVQGNCNNDLQTLTSSGFEAVINSHAQTPLVTPNIVSLDNGNTGELLVKINPVANARCLEVRYAAVAATGAPGPWQTAGLYTDSRSMSITGLTPATTYAVQVRAVGSSSRYSDWSDSVTHMCT